MKIRNTWQKIKIVTNSRFVSIAALLVLIAAIPFTIFVNQQRTQTQQHALSTSGYQVGISCFPLVNTTCIVQPSGSNISISSTVNDSTEDLLGIQLWLRGPDTNNGPWYHYDGSCSLHSCSVSNAGDTTFFPSDAGSWVALIAVYTDDNDEDGFLDLLCEGNAGADGAPGCGPQGAVFFSVGAATPTVTPISTATPTPASAGTFRVQGVRSLDDSTNDSILNNINVAVTNPNGQFQPNSGTAPEFSFNNLPIVNGNYSISVGTSNIPAGVVYRGYTMCVNLTSCHTQQPTSQTSVLINPTTVLFNGIGNNGYVDIYFHFGSTSTVTPTPTGNPPTTPPALTTWQPVTGASGIPNHYHVGDTMAVTVAGTNVGHLDAYYINADTNPSPSFSSSFTPISELTGKTLNGSAGLQTVQWTIPTSLAPQGSATSTKYWLAANVHTRTIHGINDWDQTYDIGCAWDRFIYTPGVPLFNTQVSCTNNPGSGRTDGLMPFWVDSGATASPTAFVPTDIPTVTSFPTSPIATATTVPPTPTMFPTDTPGIGQPTNTPPPTYTPAPIATNTPTQTGIPTAWRITAASNVAFNQSISQVYQGTVTDTTPPYEISAQVPLTCPTGGKTFIGQFFVDGQWVGANGAPNTVVSGTINYTANCSGPTSTPAPTATITPTSPPGATATPSPTPGATSTPVPTATIGPTSTPVPTATLAPTPTFTPGGIQLALRLNLTAIGLGGTTNPLHPQRTAQVQVFNSTNSLVADKSGPIIYNSGDGKFNGTVDLGPIPAGNYTIKVKTNQYLRKLFPGIRSLVVGANTMPEVTLIVGDVNNDNKLDILDYNTLRDCGYGAINPLAMTDPNSAFNKAACSAHPERPMADLDDNGIINAIDYNYFVRSLATQNGD